MNDYTQPSAFKSADTISQNAESLKFVKEMSDGPFEKADISDGGLYPARFAVIGPKGYESLTMLEKQCEYVTEEMNMAFHEGRKSRDSELASKDARIKELENLVADEQKQIAELKMFDNLKRRAINELLAECDRYKKVLERMASDLHPTDKRSNKWAKEALGGE